MKVKYLIIGAGVAGLSFAATLKKHGEDSFLILEKENEAGGLCRSTICNDAPIDTGGGHILDVRNQQALDFLFFYMPEEEWNIYNRNTKIIIGDNIVGYPLEANIWQFPQELQLDYLESIARVQSENRNEMPEKFLDWVYWKLGDKIAQTYMIPYNTKMWSLNDLNELGTYWLYKLPDVSFRETLLSCLNKSPSGKIPAHAQFYYPKDTGYGEVFLRIAETIKDKINYNYIVSDIDTKSLTVNNEFSAKYIINTAPWHEFITSFPADIQDRIGQLKYNSIDIDYYSTDSYDTQTHWTYYADINLPYHRVIHRDNIVNNSKGYWTETNSKRRTKRGESYWDNKYAYPLNTVNKPENIKEILDYMASFNILGLGRWGQWEHMNSDVAISHGIELAYKLFSLIR